MTGRRRNRQKQFEVIWPHFDLRRSREARGDLSLLVNNLVNVSLPRGSNHLDLLHTIANAAPRPVPVKSLSEKLKNSVFVRGHTEFGYVGDKIEAVVCNYPTLRWWMEADGLVVDESEGKLNSLFQFDRIAGALVVERSLEGRLPMQALHEIAVALDQKGFKLEDNLEPACWKLIAQHNQKFGRNAIRSFAAAVADRRFVRGVRRRLYRARDRYQKALPGTYLREIRD